MKRKVVVALVLAIVVILSGCCPPRGCQQILERPEAKRISKPPEVPEATGKIPNENFEIGTSGGLPNSWTQENYYAAAKDNGSHENSVRLTSDAYFKGNKSLYLYAKVIPPEKVLKDPSLPMGAQFTATKITSPYFDAKNKDKVSLYVTDIKDDHKSYWGWAEYIFIVFNDGSKQVPELLKPEQIEPATSEALYSHHEAAYGKDEGPKNNAISQMQGSDGKSWYKYEKAIPTQLDKSHLKISIVVVAYNWNSWGTAAYNEIGAFFDYISLE